MNFPWETAAWSFGVSVTWLQPCFFSANLLASRSSPQLSRGSITPLLGPGCWVPTCCPPSAPQHLVMHVHPHRACPQMGFKARNPCRGKAGEARATCEGEEGEGITASRAPSLRRPPPPLFCWGNQAGSNGTTCFKGLLPGTSLLFV